MYFVCDKIETLTDTVDILMVRSYHRQ